MANIYVMQLAPGITPSTAFFTEEQVSSLDAILVSTDGIFQTEMIQFAAIAKKSNIPLFVPTAAIWEESNLRKITNSDAIALPTYQSQNFAIYRALEKIITNHREINDGSNPREKYTKIKEEAKALFDRPDFYTKTSFLELMIQPELKQWADSLPQDSGKIVIDAGHIDSRDLSPTAEDRQAFEDSIILLKYLKQAGHTNVKVNMLYNEMWMRQFAEKRTVKRHIRILRQQVKEKGPHYFLRRVYQPVMDGYGVTDNEISGSFEGIIVYKTRQDLEQASTGNSPFKSEIVTTTDGTYTVLNSNLSPNQTASQSPNQAPSIKLFTESGAPVCRTLTARDMYDEQQRGAATILYLRDVKWECAIRQGAITARQLYGTTANIASMFYVTINQKIESLGLQQLN